MQSGTFYSHAKLILMGEYAVLHGAEAICLPLATGQYLNYDSTPNHELEWKWIYRDQILADFVLEPETLRVVLINEGNPGWSVELIRLIRLQNPDFLRGSGSRLIFTNNFPPEWGLGSSSATISALCRLAEVNPYLVNEKLMGGSGADIACTTAQRWFTYRKGIPQPVIHEIAAEYPFKENTFFIYSGKKQATADHLKEIRQKGRPENISWNRVNTFISEFIETVSLNGKIKIIKEHESFISKAINKEPFGKGFHDFPGEIKSLGAWGGDFFMAISHKKSKIVKDYFLQKGLDKVFSWNELEETTKF